jgi:O-phospho-L-seryl-tRNASec:L-selenocysteinyl-tRNA synthase
VAKGKKQEISGITFSGYGSHCDAYPHVYLTAAAALGTRLAEVDEFGSRLVDAYNEFMRKHVQV